MKTTRWQPLFVMMGLLLCTTAPRRSHAAQDTDEVAEASAQNRRRRQPFKTLAARIPAVSRRAVSKTHRAELSVQLGLSLTEPFYRYIAPGVSARYHFSETWAVGALFDYDAAISTPPSIVSRANQAAAPDLNHANLLVGAEAIWSPLYGKINWLAESVSHFDMYASVGAGFMALHHGSALAGTFAIGQHYFVTPLAAFKIELREVLYGMARDPQAAGTSRLESLTMASVGVSFFVPKPHPLSQP